MKHFFPGILGAFFLGWLLQVGLPYASLAKLEPVVDPDTNVPYPYNVSGLAQQGRSVYAANGCVSCHTQQVRAAYMGADVERKWGTRQSVARDYIYEDAVFLGSMRAGPDLSSVGARDFSGSKAEDLSTVEARAKNAQWHFVHLYNPRIVRPKSNMPPYGYLFDLRKIKGQRSNKALDLPAPYTPPEGFEVVPTPEAEALVGYLLSLNKNHDVPEMKGAPAPAAAAK
ncbi:MAG TPA: cbb3-type cytochrome c oxidase subunit II [Chthoniobacterales bacterium]|jgi:cytochrome c oxidase cbb3-type subunit 2